MADVFFFQAEDGIRDDLVTGVQTCALPISNPYQTRRDFNEKALEELRESIAVQGVLQPIVVRPAPEGRFILILGERRVRGSQVAGKGSAPGGMEGGFWTQRGGETLVGDHTPGGPDFC